MRVYDYEDGKHEGRVLAAMLVSAPVLARVASVWRGDGPFASDHCNALGRMCVDYHAKYRRPPGAQTPRLIEDWDERHPGRGEQAELMARVLQDHVPDGDFAAAARDLDPGYCVDLAQRVFDTVAKRQLIARVASALDRNDLAAADEAVSRHRRVELSQEAGSFLDEPSIWQQAAEREEGPPLFTYPGHVGVLINDELRRGRLVTLLAAEKRGKSFVLMDLAWEAMEQRRRVAFFGAGDMNRDQVLMRLGARAAGLPYRPGTARVPQGIRMRPPVAGQPDRAEVTSYEEIVTREFLPWERMVEGYQRVLQRRAHSRGRLFYLSCHPNTTLSVHAIEAILDDKERADGWVADVICVDYSDILVPPPGIQERRDQHDAVWKALRGMADERNALVLTATQANASSYKAESLSMSHYSEDKRKLAHANAQIGINVTAEEKKADIMRLNLVVSRESQFSSGQHVHVAGCRGIGRPIMFSLNPEWEAAGR